MTKQRKFILPADKKKTRQLSTENDLLLANDEGRVRVLARTLHFLFRLLKNFWLMASFAFLVILLVCHLLLLRVLQLKIIPTSLSKKTTSLVQKVYQHLVGLFERHNGKTISRVGLIELSLKTMQVKRTRSMVTMGGMALGIALIVFLVSIGYGLQQVVISRVVKLNEMRQADVVPGLTPDLVLTDQAMTRFNQLAHVIQVYPIITAVGRVVYQDSASDIAVYGVTTNYLVESAVAPVKGRTFDSNLLSLAPNTSAEDQSSQVLGVADKAQLPTGVIGQKLHRAVLEPAPTRWLRVRSGPSTAHQVLGYTRLDQPLEVTQLYGSSYQDQGEVLAGSVAESLAGEPLGYWLGGTFQLWQAGDCTQTQVDVCLDGQYSPLLDESGQTVFREGYTAQLDLAVLVETNQTSQPSVVMDGLGLRTEATVSQVLGETTIEDETDEAEDSEQAATTQETTDEFQTASQVVSSDGSLELIELVTDELLTTQSRQAMPVAGEPAREIVVNRAVLDLIGLSEEEALGKQIEVKMVVLGELLADSQETIESVATKYTIVGITPEKDTPVAFVPFVDVRSLGVDRFSQTRVVTNSPEALGDVRANIESLGYATTSVADTVAQIDRLFASLRLLLSVLGLVALSVAALGMFNTLTVSLLERTHEVGLLKAMGMSSSEVRELFLTESMIMGFFGGLLGLFAGVVGGKMLGLLLSAVSLSWGSAELIAISQTPISFAIGVVFLSLIIGLMTGWYPAYRATKISALDALRYE